MVVDEGDVHLTADVRGHGPLVLCHPGLGRWSRDFEPLVDTLVRAGRRVALFDPRGVGESTGPLDDLTLFQLADDLLRVARRLAEPPFDLVGHAFGSRVVRAAATIAPDDVARVVLLAAGGGRSGTAAATAALAVAMDLDAERVARVEALRRALFAPGNDPTPWLDWWHPGAIAAQRHAATSTPEAAWSGAGRARVWFVQGLEDRLAPIVGARELAAALGDRATVVEVAGAGHALLPEQPRAVAAAILDALAA